MKIYDAEICTMLAREGLPVDEQSLVRFPSEVVRQALASSPSSFSLFDHHGQEIPFRSGNPLPAVYSNAVKIWDWTNNEVRPSRREDLVRCVRLADAIPEIRVACPVCLPNELPQPSQMPNAITILLQNCSKLTEAAPHDLEEARYWTDAVAVADQKISVGPTLMFTVSPTSPLQIDPGTCQVMKHGAKHGVPLLISPCPMAGATSPFTMAGTTVQSHSEFLGMLVVTQLLREGLPVVYGGSAGPMDLKVGSLSYGAPERNTMLCANIDIADYFGLPHFSSAGSVDSVSPDFQTGQSKALAWLTRLMKGTSLGIWFGSLLTGSTVAPEQIVLDADLFRSVRSMLKGMELDDDHLGFEAIERVGPGGNHMMDEHTLRWMRSDEYYASPVVNNEGEHGRSILDRAHEQVESILRDCQPSVSPDVVTDLEKLLSEHE